MAINPPLLSRGRHDFTRRHKAEEPAAQAPVDRAALCAQAADKLADILLAEPGSGWARFALEAVQKQPVKGL